MRKPFGGNMMRQLIWWRAVLVVLGLGWTPFAASGADRALSRAEAVKSLEQPAALARMKGAVRLAEIGIMRDADLLAARLHDDDGQVREVAAAAMWQIWSRSGDKATDARYQRGIKLMQARRLDEAVVVFSDIIKKQPAFAEAWNKRATLYFMQGQFDLSLKDCDEVMKRNRHHFGALSGYGQIYIQKGDYRRAIQYLERALKVNPNQAGTADTIEVLEEKLQERQRKTI